MDEERPLRAELRGERTVHELARVRAAHLEEHAELELLDGVALERPLQVRQRIAPDERVDADGRPVAQDRHEVLRRAGLLVAAERKAEVALAAPQFAEPGEVAHHEEDRLAVEHLLIETPLHLGGELGHPRRHGQPAHDLHLVGQGGGELLEHDVGLLLGDRRLQQHEAARPTERPARMRIEAGGEAHHRHRQQARAEVLSLADDEHVGPALASEDGGRRVLDRDRVPHPGQRCDRLAAVDRPLGQELGEQRIAGGIRGLVAVEDDPRQMGDVGATVGERPQRPEIALPTLVVEEHHLERTVAVDHAVGVVVDRLAGPGEQTGGRIVLGEDETRVGLVALEGHPHRHLPHRRAGQAVRPAERLGAEQHVHAERATLADEAVEDERRVLRELVILDEHLLKLVDEQEDARHRIGVPGPPEAGHVLHRELAEQVAAPLQFRVELLEHREPELAFTLDRDDARMRQPVVVVELELDALLEVDEIELDLVRAVLQREARDHRVHEGRLAGAGLAGDEGVLAGALAEPQVLQLLRSRRAERREHLARRAPLPPFLLRRRDAVEGHLDPLRGLRRLADPLDDAREDLVGRRRLDGERPLRELLVLPGEGAPGEVQHGRMLLELGEAEPGGHDLLRVDGDDDVHAAARPRRGDAGEPPGTRLGEVGRKVRDADELVGFRDLRVGVVVADRRVLVAEILLNDDLHLLGDVAELLLDQRRFGPDAAGHQQLVVVGQVHEAGELLAEPEGVDDCEPGLSRGNAGGDPQHQRLHEPGGGLLLLRRRPDHERGLLGPRHRRGLLPLRRAEGIEFGHVGHPSRQRGEREAEVAESQAGRHHGREGHVVLRELVPWQEGRGVEPAGLRVDRRGARTHLAPCGGHLFPALVPSPIRLRDPFVTGHLARAHLLREGRVERREPRGILPLGLIDDRGDLLPQTLDRRGVLRLEFAGGPLPLRRQRRELRLHPRLAGRRLLLELPLDLLRQFVAAGLEPPPAVGSMLVGPRRDPAEARPVVSEPHAGTTDPPQQLPQRDAHPRRGQHGTDHRRDDEPSRSCAGDSGWYREERGGSRQQADQPRQRDRGAEHATGEDAAGVTIPEQRLRLFGDRGPQRLDEGERVLGVGGGGRKAIRCGRIGRFGRGRLRHLPLLQLLRDTARILIDLAQQPRQILLRLLEEPRRLLAFVPENLLRGVGLELLVLARLLLLLPRLPIDGGGLRPPRVVELLLLGTLVCSGLLAHVGMLPARGVGLGRMLRAGRADRGLGCGAGLFGLGDVLGGDLLLEAGPFGGSPPERLDLRAEDVRVIGGLVHDPCIPESGNERWKLVEREGGERCRPREARWRHRPSWSLTSRAARASTSARRPIDSSVSLTLGVSGSMARSWNAFAVPSCHASRADSHLRLSCLSDSASFDAPPERSPIFIARPPSYRSRPARRVPHRRRGRRLPDRPRG